MSIIGIGGQGIPLPYPGGQYPNTPVFTGNTNAWVLPAGNAFLIPSGTWLVEIGKYSFLQCLDPVSGLWVNVHGFTAGGAQQVNSDGVNWRVANMTGTAVGGVVTTAGSGYTSAPSVTADGSGGSLWKAYISGAVSTTVTVGTAGANYSLPPLVFFSAPPAGGLQATGYATLTTGAVSGITVTNQGAGYLVAPTIYILPDPRDPNAGTLTPAAATAALQSAGSICAVVCTYPGSPVTAAPTLTVSGGGGSSGAVSAVMCFSITGFTVGTQGATVAGSAVDITGVGGQFTTAAAATALQPAWSNRYFTVRKANAFAAVTAGAVSTTVNTIDSGLYQTAPTVMIVQGSGAAPGTAPAATAAVGGVPDYCYMTPLL